MTPINPSTGSALPYNVVTSNGSTDDASQAYTTNGYSYVAPASPVSGTQPAVASAPAATIQDIASIGVYTDSELQQILQMNLSPQQLGELYVATIEYIQSDEFAQMYGAQMPAASTQSVDPGIYANTGGSTPVDPGIYANTGGSTPVDPGIYASTDGVSASEAPVATPAADGWSDEWNSRFQSALKQLGLDSQTRMLVTSSLRQLGLSDAELQQAFDYYTGSPEGLAELQQANEQVLAGKPDNAKQLLQAGLVSAVGVGSIVLLGRSRKNLTKMLQRTVAATGKHSENGLRALRALKQMESGKLVPGSEVARDAVRALRTESSTTSRMLHPIQKVRLNAAARGLTESTRLSRGDLLRYGTYMKFGDNVDEVAKAASAVKAAGTAAKVAGGGGAEAAAAAARGAGMLGKAGKLLGPVGIVLSAGVGAWGISKTMEAEGGFGEESAKMTGNVAGGLAGGLAGAAAGAAIGSVVPVIGTGVGAIVGGLIGGFGGGAIGESIGGALHGLFGGD